jgi:hypothetical protein
MCLCSPHIVFEVWADGRGITHRLRLHEAQADYIVGQLRVHLPGVRVTPESSPPQHSWVSGVELGLTNPAHRLRIDGSDQLAAGLLASMAALQPDEAVLYQLVLTSAAAEKPPAKSSTHSPRHRRVANYGLLVPEPESDDVNDLRTKASEVNFLGVVRLAARAATSDQASELVNLVEASLASTTSPYTRFKRRFVPQKSGLFTRIEQARAPLVYPAQFSVSEIAGLSAWPIGRPNVSGLPQGQARQLPATSAIPRTGRIIGISNFPGDERPIAISHGDACQHLQVLGPTGTGKTTALANMARQDMEQGYGVIVLEGKGDLFEAVLERVPRSRIKDAIVLDVNDTSSPVGFNVLASGTTRSAVDELSAVTIAICGDNGGVYAPMLLHYGLHALAESPGNTFIDLPSLLTPQSSEEAAWRDELVRNLKNRDVRRFWQHYLGDKNNERDRMAAPVHNRIWRLGARPEVRNIIGQSRSSFTFEDLLTNNKILLINLNGVRVGESTASITGTLLMNALWSAVRRVRSHRPSYLYIDEFQDFLNLQVGAADMLAKARSFGLGLVLAHQDLDQLAKVRGLERAVLANARSKIVFQTSAGDARVMQREFGRLVDEQDFLTLGRYEALARVATGDGVSQPITMTALPPSKPTGTAEAVRTASRNRYGRPISEVEAEIDARRRPSATDSQRHKPKVGPQTWS